MFTDNTKRKKALDDNRLNDLKKHLGNNESMFALQPLFETAVDQRNRPALALIESSLVGHANAPDPHFHANQLASLIDRILVEWPEALNVFIDRTAYVKDVQLMVMDRLVKHDRTDYIVSIINDYSPSFEQSLHLGELSEIPSTLLDKLATDQQYQKLLSSRAQAGAISAVRRILKHYDPDENAQLEALREATTEQHFKTADYLLKQFGIKPETIFNKNHRAHLARQQLPTLLAGLEHYDLPITDTQTLGYIIQNDPTPDQMQTVMAHADAKLFEDDKISRQYEMGTHLSADTLKVVLDELSGFVPRLQRISSRSMALFLKYDVFDDPIVDLSIWFEVCDHPDLTLIPDYLSDEKRLKLVCQGLKNLPDESETDSDPGSELTASALLGNWIKPEQTSRFTPDELQGEGLREVDVVANYAFVQDQPGALNQILTTWDDVREEPELNPGFVRPEALEDVGWETYRAILRTWPVNKLAYWFGEWALSALYRDRYINNEYADTLQAFRERGCDLLPDDREGRRAALQSLSGGDERRFFRAALHQADIDPDDGGAILHGVIDRAYRPDVDVIGRLQEAHQAGARFSGEEARSALLRIIDVADQEYPASNMMAVLKQIDDNWPVEWAVQEVLENENDYGGAALIQVMLDDDQNLLETDDALRKRLPRILDALLKNGHDFNNDKALRTITGQLAEHRNYAKRTLNCFEVLIEHGASFKTDGARAVLEKLVEIEQDADRLAKHDHERPPQSKLIRDGEFIKKLIELIARYSTPFAPGEEWIEQLKNLPDTSPSDILSPLRRRKKQALQQLDVPVNFE